MPIPSGLKCSLLWLSCLGYLHFLDLCVFFFHQVNGVFWSFFKWDLNPLFSLFFWVWMLLLFMLSLKSLKPSSFFNFLFLLLCLRVFCYLVFQITDSILCFSQPTVYSFQCILHVRYGILHFWLVPFYDFYVFFMLL